MKVRWTAPALRDLELIGDFIARDNPAAADRIVNRILDQAELLAAHPNAGAPDASARRGRWSFRTRPTFCPTA